MPAVSVITTVYNGMPYLQESVESVLNQSLKDFEYVIVNDGSDDGTRSYLDSIGDSRIKILHLPRKERGFALNKGLAVCQADYIAILDADDMLSPVQLEWHYEWMQKHPEISVLSCVCALEKEQIFKERHSGVSLTEVDPRSFIRRMPINHSGVMMKRAALKAVGGYDAGRKDLFDFDLWLRLAEQGYRFGKVHAPLVFKRVHQNQKFEARRRLAYLYSGLRMRWKAVRIFSKVCSFDVVCPFIAFFFGLLPRTIRRRIFGLSCE